MEGGRQGEREAFCLSLILPQEGLGLRTYSPILESLSLIIASKSCRTVHIDQSSAFCFFHTLCFSLPSLPLSVIYCIYSLHACHPSPDSVPPAFVPAYSSLSASVFQLALLTFSPLLLLLNPSCVSPVQSTVDIMSLTSQSGSRWECCAGAYCPSTDAAKLQRDLYTALPIFLAVFCVSSLDFASAQPKISQ